MFATLIVESLDFQWGSGSLSLLQIFSLSLFEKIPINELFTNLNYKTTGLNNPNQLNLFEL